MTEQELMAFSEAVRNWINLKIDERPLHVLSIVVDSPGDQSVIVASDNLRQDPSMLVAMVITLLFELQGINPVLDDCLRLCQKKLNLPANQNFVQIN